MLAVIGSRDRYLGSNITRIATEERLRSVRTNKIERVINELKAPGRVAVIDVAWEDVQVPGVLKRLVNLGRISRNDIVCICPNQDEELKKLARDARPQKVFIRYDLETTFREYLRTV